MNNFEKYKKIFLETFGVDNSAVESLQYRSVESWDSIGHMTLISVIEETFNISMEADDIIELSSFQKGIEILKKYNISMDK